MPLFEVTGIKTQTGRKNKRTYRTPGKREALEEAIREGIAPKSIAEMPEPPEPEPTDRQIEYAQALGATIPPDATRAEASDLIDNALRGKPPASERYRRWAQRYNVPITQYTNKHEIFERIFSRLRHPNQTAELAAWFLFRVHRHLVHGNRLTEIDGPDHPGLRAAANSLAEDPKFLASIVNGYAEKDLVWFGEFTAASGETFNGGSTRTYAYKTAKAALQPWVAGTETPAPRNTATKKKLRAKPRSGKPDAHRWIALLVIVFFLVLLFL